MQVKALSQRTQRTSSCARGGSLQAAMASRNWTHEAQWSSTEHPRLHHHMIAVQVEIAGLQELVHATEIKGQCQGSVGGKGARSARHTEQGSAQGSARRTEQGSAQGSARHILVTIHGGNPRRLVARTTQP